jgi:DNA-binding MarR family transcriptional regulator
MRDAADAGGSADGLRFGALSGSLGLLLRLAQIVSFRDFFESLGHLGMRPGEATALMLIGENPGVRQGELARQLMIKRAHMTKMVRAMETAGLVSRSVPDDDRRSVALRLSPAGEAEVASLRGPFLAHEAGAARGLSRREEAELKRLLCKYLGLAPPAAEAGR